MIWQYNKLMYHMHSKAQILLLYLRMYVIQQLCLKVEIITSTVAPLSSQFNGDTTSPLPHTAVCHHITTTDHVTSLIVSTV